MKIAFILCFVSAVALAGPVRTAGILKPDLVAVSQMVKAEKAGTVLTTAQIEALVDSGKTKEAMKAQFARETKFKALRADAKASAGKADKKADRKEVKADKKVTP